MREGGASTPVGQQPSPKLGLDGFPAVSSTRRKFVFVRALAGVIRCLRIGQAVLLRKFATQTEMVVY
jgi:hypothetical protein